jgi:hypothetical protein
MFVMLIDIDFYRWYEVHCENSEEFDSIRREQLDDVVRNPVELAVGSGSLVVVLTYSFILGDHQQLQVLY